jgi:hypothetical protein
MRRALVFAALVLVGAAFVLAPVGGAGVAGADAPDQIGWWSKLNGGATSGLPVAPPVATPAPPLDPSAPAGSIQLAVDPSGPAGIGAVRYDSVPEGSDVTLVLKSSRPLPPPEAFSVVLCTAATPWVGVENGAWSARPSWTSTCATPTVDSDTLTWHLDSSFLDEGLSAVLVPSAAVAYQVTINPPDANSLTFEAPPAEEPAPEPTPDPGLVIAPVESPVVTTPIVQEPVVTTPPVAPRPRVTPTTIARVRPAATVPKPLKDLTRGERMAAVALLLGLVGAWWWVGGQPVRNPRLLGSVGAGPSVAAAGSGGPVGTQSVTTVARLGGVGRFAKLRTSAPRRL